MRKSVYPYFKLYFITCIVLQAIVFLLSLLGYLYFREGTLDDFVIPVCGLVDILSLGVVMLSMANRLTYVNISDYQIISFSLLNQKMCVIDLSIPFFYARVRVPNRNSKIGYIDALYISNKKFECKTSLVGGKVIKKYSNKTMVMFPYDKDADYIANLSFANCAFS